MDKHDAPKGEGCCVVTFYDLFVNLGVSGVGARVDVSLPLKMVLLYIDVVAKKLILFFV